MAPIADISPRLGLWFVQLPFGIVCNVVERLLLRTFLLPLMHDMMEASSRAPSRGSRACIVTGGGVLHGRSLILGRRCCWG